MISERSSDKWEVKWYLVIRSPRGVITERWLAEWEKEPRPELQSLVHVDRRGWRAHQLTSDLKRCLLFRKCLRFFESESSFGAYVCHRRPGGSTATSHLVNIPRELLCVCAWVVCLRKNIYMSRPIYCHGPIIYCHSPIYCHNSIYGMTFKPFRMLCLEGASCCCLDLYAAMTYKLFQNKKKSCGERV